MGKKADKYMGTVKVGAKGQIVIPADVREIFGIEPGDSLLLMADKKRGIAVTKSNKLLDKISDAVFDGTPDVIYQGDLSPDEEKTFDEEILKKMKGE